MRIAWGLVLVLTVVYGDIVWDIPFTNVLLSPSCFTTKNSVIGISYFLGFQTDPTLLAYDINTGNPLWTSNLTGPGFDGEVVGGNFVVLYSCALEWGGEFPACLAVIDPLTGHPTASSAPNTQGTTSLDAQPDNTLIFTSSDATGSLSIYKYAVGPATLDIVWNVTLGEALQRRALDADRPKRTYYSTDDALVMVNGYSVIAFSQSSGAKLWETPLPTIFANAPGPDAIYLIRIINNGMNFAAVSASTGKVLVETPTTIPNSVWNSTFGRCGIAQQVAGVGVFLCNSGDLGPTWITGIEGNTGKQIYQIPLNCQFPGATGYNTLVGNFVYFSASCDNQALNTFKMDPTTGTIVWNTTLPGVDFDFFAAAPMVGPSGDTIVVSTGTRVVQISDKDGTVIGVSTPYAQTEDNNVAYLCSPPAGGKVFLSRSTFWQSNENSALTLVQIK